MIYYAIRQKKTGDFVSHVSKTGKVSLRKNPFNANYFLTRGDAENWKWCKDLPDTDYEVKAFERTK